MKPRGFSLEEMRDLLEVLDSLDDPQTPPARHQQALEGPRPVGQRAVTGPGANPLQRQTTRRNK